jgi:hypothetical protein
MKNYITWLIEIGGGIALIVLGMVLPLDKTITMMFTVFGIVLLVLPSMQIMTAAKRARLFPFLGGIDDDEQVTLYADRRDRLMPVVVIAKHEGILHKRGMGIVEDKGTPLTWAETGIPISISRQRIGVTIDLKMAQYQDKLEGAGLEDYEEAIKRYLGPASYMEFSKKYRTDEEPQYEEISKELSFLLEQEPNDKLCEVVSGDTVTFKNYLVWLKYVYSPLSAENAIDSEILETRREAMANSQGGKVQNWGKLILVILIGVGIFLVIISTMGPQLGKLFGG